MGGFGEKMFKVLVTTFCNNSNGTSVHAFEIDFTTAAEAQVAVSIINKNSHSMYITQTAKLLFEVKE